MARRADVLTAVVEGTTAYSVRVRVSDDPNGLDGACTCPVGDGGGFCKHCVAAALAWLEQRERRQGAAEAERLGRWLETLAARAAYAAFVSSPSLEAWRRLKRLRRPPGPGPRSAAMGWRISSAWHPHASSEPRTHVTRGSASLQPTS